MAIPSPIKSPAPRTPAPSGVPAVARPEFPAPTFTGERGPSVIHPAVRQMILITGFRGQGKTTFALGAENPANVLMLDYESKGEGFARPLGVGGYFSILDDCAATYGKDFRPLHILQRTQQIIGAVPQDRFTVLILDNAALLQEGCVARVELTPGDFGVKAANAASGSFGGAWPGVKFILKALFSEARAKGVEVIIVTFQLTKAWGQTGPLLNKFKTTDVALWHEASVLSLVLGDPMPDHFPAPSALVMKEQLADLRWDADAGRLIKQRRLPYKLPNADMAEVYNFLREPFNFKMDLAEQIKQGYYPKPGELDPFTPTFGKEQLAQLEKWAKVVAEQKEGEGE